MAPVNKGRRFILFLVAPLAGPLLTAAIVGVTKSLVEREKEMRAREEARLQEEAARKGWSYYWTPLATGLQAVRSSGWGWSPLMKGFHAVRSGLEGVRPSWGGWTRGFDAISQGALSAVQGLRSSISLSPYVKLGVACGGAASSGSLRVTVSSVADGAPAPLPPSSYALVLCLTSVDGKYVLDLLCSDERQVLDLRSKLMAAVPSSEFRVSPQLLALQVISSYSRYQLGLPPCSFQDFVKIKNYVEQCVNGALSGNWFGQVPANLKKLYLDKGSNKHRKEVVHFLARHDLTWVLQVASGIVGQLNSPSVETVCGALVSVYRFNRNVATKELSGEDSSVPLEAHGGQAVPGPGDEPSREAGGHHG